MKIEFTEAEMSALITKARAGRPLPFAFTASGVCTLESENPQASWAIAELALMRKPRANLIAVTVGTGVPMPTGPRQTPKSGDPLAGHQQCGQCKSATWMCGQCGQDEYSFPYYGERLDASGIASALVATGLVGMAGAEALAASLDSLVYVLREVDA